ncbi:MAG: hypothetical protein ACE5KH_00755 [Candidatus Geothermarchaeales archaeon]
MDRDRALGFLVFIVAILVFIGYTYYALLASSPLEYNPLGFLEIDSYWVTAVPLWLGITVVLLIGAWIGWTLFTTPPPVPIEEFEGLESFTEEMEKEKAEEPPKEEAKKTAKKKRKRKTRSKKT